MNHDKVIWITWYRSNKTRITHNEDGSINYDGTVYLNGLNLTHIPFKFNKVNGYFDCSNNKLTSLENCPNILKNMYIHNNTFFNVKSLLEKEIYRVLQWGELR